MDKKILTISFVIVACIIAFVANTSKESLGAGMNVIESPSISTVEAATSSTAIVRANVGRQYLQVCNTDANDTYCAFGETAVATQGIFLDASGGCFTVNLDNLFIGAFNCISETAASTLSIIEK